MERRHTKARVDQGWILFWNYFDESPIVGRFVGVLAYRLSSTFMLDLVPHLYIISHLTVEEQFHVEHGPVPYPRESFLVLDDAVSRPRASFIFLNDASLDQDKIVCSMPGRQGALMAYRANDVVLFEDEDGKTFVSCQVPYLTADEHGKRMLDYIDEFILEVPSSAS